MTEERLQPKLIARSDDISGDSNFTQGCIFSPDGLCVLTCTASDNKLRIYNTPAIPPEPPDDNPQIQSENQDQDQENQNQVQNKREVGIIDIANKERAAPLSSTYTSSPTDVVAWQTVLSFAKGDSVRSYSWYPLMNSYNPVSCAFISANRDQPIHLVDAYNATIRASYRPYNALDEVEAPNVVAFTPDGNRIFASGFKTDRTIHVFDTAIPGRDSEVLRLGKTRRSTDGQKGLVSALSFPDGNGFFAGNNIFAVGTCSPGSIYIYDDRKPSGNPAGVVLNGGVCVVGHGRRFSRKKRRYDDVYKPQHDDQPTSAVHHDGCAGIEGGSAAENEDIFSMAKVNWYQSRSKGGITQLTWSKSRSDFLLFSASRRSDSVIGWDMRMLSGNPTHHIGGVCAYSRDGDTNQRLEFDFNESGEKIFVASQDSSVKIYDVKSCVLSRCISGFCDTVNGVSYRKDSDGGQGLLAVGVGARRFDDIDIDTTDTESGVCDADTMKGRKHRPEGSLELYKL